MTRVIAVLILFAFGQSVRAEASPELLQEAVQKWLGERDHWAFTQRAIEYAGNNTRERLERYDPSLGGNRRWQLLAINGNPPTEEERANWERRKFRKHRRRFDSPIGDYFDFDHAKVVSETPAVIQYQVPLRSDKNWLFSTEKVDVAVTVNKQTRALEHLTAHVREPFKVLLGIARITGGTLDLAFDEAGDSGPETAQPSGSARVSVFRMGERVDFTWSDFKRVVPVASRDTDGPTPRTP